MTSSVDQTTCALLKHDIHSHTCVLLKQAHIVSWLDSHTHCCALSKHGLISWSDNLCSFKTRHTQSYLCSFETSRHRQSIRQSYSQLCSFKTWPHQSINQSVNFHRLLLLPTNQSVYSLQLSASSHPFVHPFPSNSLRHPPPLHGAVAVWLLLMCPFCLNHNVIALVRPCAADGMLKSNY